MTAADPTMAALTAAVERGRAGDRLGARERLAELWRQVGPAGDPLHRVTVAHFLADLQDDVRDELAWDERALADVAELTDERTARFDPGMQVRGFLPSLQLSVADCHRRLGDPVAARRHLAEAEQLVHVLADDDYGRLIRAALTQIRDALDEGSTDLLRAAP
ncbi:hypothetical protein [Modestobacter sp. I12A-02662]|uniref:hypothetical protein n=1 Tax=Modestobacter sp. I12A-02662 TaxID=1730496 RepID=UPI0034DE68B9